MAELDGDADVDSLGFAIYDLVTLVVVEGRVDADPVTGVEVP